ncbi:MAG: WG repeat-containing protein [Alphaproteobacteria bacterium]|nr:WG repeat-containing protein [Alphaproteobacteria bacterium]
MISAQYDYIYDGDYNPPLFVEGSHSTYTLPTMIVVKKNNELWWIDRTGTKIFESFFFDNGPDYFKNGLSRILKKNKFGFINKEGHVVIEPQYDFASPFDEAGFSNVCTGCWKTYPPHTKFPIAHNTVDFDACGYIVGGKWGIISVAGKVAVPLVHSSSENARKALQEELLYK